MLKKMLIAAAVLAVAIGVYVFLSVQQNSNPSGETEVSQENETAPEFVSSENVYDKRSKDDISAVSIENTENGYTIDFTRGADNSFIVDGYGDVEFNGGVIDSLMNHVQTLYYTDKIENVGELSEYGLDAPKFIMNAKYKDGTQTSITVGDRTQDSAYNYVMFNDDKNVYLSSIDNYLMYSYEFSDFVYKYIPAVSKESIMYLDVKQKGKDEIEIAFKEEKTGNAAEMASYGMQTLTMIKPLEGAAVYPINLQDTVLSALSLLTLDKVYKVDPTETDIAECGLGAPFLAITMIDGNGTTVVLNVGNEADESRYYCMTPLYPHIFTIQKTAVENFIDIDILDFSEKFVQLINRKLVSSIEMKENGERKYEVKFEGKDMSTPEDQHDTRVTAINGKTIDYENFGKFYQVFAGITFDSIIDPQNVGGTPDMEFAVHLVDGGIKSIKYYPYADDVNFYVVSVDDGEATRLVSKRSVREVFAKAGTLTE